jgi:uncharacterized DUF497 family protein
MKYSKLSPKDLIWDKTNIAHISRHKLLPRQVDQLLLDPNRVFSTGKKERLTIMGRTGKRLVIVFLSKQNKKYYVVTARDMDKEERDFYRNN